MILDPILWKSKISETRLSVNRWFWLRSSLRISKDWSVFADFGKVVFYFFQILKRWWCFIFFKIFRTSRGLLFFSDFDFGKVNLVFYFFQILRVGVLFFSNSETVLLRGLLFFSIFAALWKGMYHPYRSRPPKKNPGGREGT